MTDTPAQFGGDLAATDVAVFTCDVDAFIAQGAAPAASAADGSALIPGGTPILIDGNEGVALSVVRKAVDGVATLQKVKALV